MGTRFALNEDQVSYLPEVRRIEFGRVSVNTDVLLGEASRDARRLVDSKRYLSFGDMRLYITNLQWPCSSFWIDLKHKQEFQMTLVVIRCCDIPGM